MVDKSAAGMEITVSKYIVFRHDEKSNPLSFLAFGYGPRICIGMRLALVEMKIALVHVLRRVKFERMPNTKVHSSCKGPTM